MREYDQQHNSHFFQKYYCKKQVESDETKQN